MPNNNDDFYNLYKESDTPLTNLFNMWGDETEEKVSQKFVEKIQLAQQILNTSYSIATPYVSLALSQIMEKNSERGSMLFSAYHRNLFAFYGALDLTKRGLFGPARPILRHIFEALIIAKYLSLSEDPKIYKAWEKGGFIYLSKQVLKKIEAPDPSSFQEFWKTLSEVTHATRYSQQISFLPSHVLPHVHFNLDLILGFLECHYHLLSSHFLTSSIKYYGNYYSDQQSKLNELHTSKRKIRELFKKARTLNKNPKLKKCVRDYKSSWILKS